MRSRRGYWTSLICTKKNERCQSFETKWLKILKILLKNEWSTVVNTKLKGCRNQPNPMVSVASLPLAIAFPPLQPAFGIC